MLSRGWRMGALAVGAMIACGGTAFAGDDVKTLKLTASSVIGDGDSIGIIEEGRALPADDLTDVNLRYRLGYARGANGGAYFLPRFYAFRAGFSDGLYGNTWAGYGWGARWGYWGPRWAYGGPRWAGFWGAGRGYYGGYYGGPYYYSSYSYPSCSCYSGPVYGAPLAYSSPSASYSLSDPNGSYIPGNQVQPMATPEPPMSQPAPQLLPEPMPKKTNYQYNGDPLNPVPQPIRQQSVHPNSDGRLVGVPAAQKHSYSAYGENRKTKSDSDSALLVKQN
jgi:hypothetical protein